jgi:hypothetical protein
MQNLAPVTVAVFVRRPEDEMRLRSELHGFDAVQFCDVPQRLTQIVASGGVRAAVMDFDDPLDPAVMESIATLRREAPRVRIVLSCTPSPDVFERAAPALAVGAADCAIRGFDTLDRMIRGMLAPTWQPGAALALIRHLVPLVTRELEAFAIACAMKASPLLALETLQDWLGVSDRTLRDRLQRASLQGPSNFLAYCSAARSAWLLDLHGLEPGQVVDAMGFKDTRALNRLLRQYGGKPAQAFREHGGAPALVVHASSILRRRAVRRGSVA